MSVERELTGESGPRAADSGQQSAPGPFRDAVTSMHDAKVRGGITVTDIRPPRKLAPYSHAVGLEVDRLLAGDARDDGGEAAVPVNIPTDADGDAFGRLILLHDPGTDEGPTIMKLVAYIQADLDSSVAQDPLLPDVAWDWLTEELDQLSEDGDSADSAESGESGESSPAAAFSDLGGTVTATASSRFGDIAGPASAFQIELRASWTATGTDLSGHVTAFAHVLANVAGLPPEGITAIGSR